MWFPERYASEFEDRFDARRSPTRPAVYACAPGPAHGIWPERDEALFLMVNAPADPSLRDGVDEEWIGSRAGVAEIWWRRSPADLAERFPGSYGALYGAASNSKAAAFLRPPNRSSEVRGLYLASGSAHPGGGLPMVATSGRLAARAVLGDLG